MTGKVGGNWNWKQGSWGYSYGTDPFGEDADGYGMGDDFYGGEYAGYEDGMAAGEMGGMAEDAEEIEEKEEPDGAVATEGPTEETEVAEAAAAEEGAPNGEQSPAVKGPILPIGGFSSPHPGGSQFAFGDGHVEFLTESIDKKTYQQLGSRNDGKLLSAWDY
jgi:prepilin-type processing-associated H-X9-DG protein